MTLSEIFHTFQSNANEVTFTWETVIAIFGALAWFAPWVYELLRGPKLQGKLISQHMNKGEYKNKEGLIYFLRLSIISLRKQFNIKELKLKVKYPGDDEEYKGSVCWFYKSFWIDSNRIQFTLNIPNNEFLGFMSSIPKDDPLRCYVTFFVDKGTIEEYDYIKLEFVPFRGKMQTISFNRENIDPDLMLWDDDIWKPVQQSIG